MKFLGRILLIIAALISVICSIWVMLTPGAFDSKGYEGEWMANPATSIIIFGALFFFGFTLLSFAIYKVVDLIKHPSHMKEAIWVVAAIAIALVIGFVFSGSEPHIGLDKVYEGMSSKLIGTGLITSMVLFGVCVLFLLYDTVKGIIKG